MKENDTDDMIYSFYSRDLDIPGKGQDCPELDELSMYLSGELAADSLYKTGRHVKNCKYCTELIESSLLFSAYGNHIKLETVAARIKNKAKALNPKFKLRNKNMINSLKRNVWLTLSIFSLSASFIVHTYFLQFLILGLLFGLKWVFNKESTRTLIMVYNAWKRHDKTGREQIEEIFKSRL